MILSTFDEALDLIFNKTAGDIRMATPLGLGKPNQFINMIYDRCEKNAGKCELEIYTALSLAIPNPKTDLEKRFLKPFIERHFGSEYPQLKYVQALEKNSLPENIRVHEFYFMAGKMLNKTTAQKDYISLNYTHVVPALCDRGVNVIVQMVSKRDSQYSLSCNPDLTLDLIDYYKKRNKPILKIALVNPELPFLSGEAQIEEDFFDAIVETPQMKQNLFALPLSPVDEIDHAIGFYASHLVADNGTLQIGIGSLSDAVVASLILRHQDNQTYKNISQKILSRSPSHGLKMHTEVFTEGLYGTSEMVMDGFMHLRKAGILKRFVKDEIENKQTYLHGGFFLGSKEFYSWLKKLSAEDFDGLSMTRISHINDLYDPDQMAIRKQRINARFMNTCMQMTLLGSAASETLESGQVVSGVGGQYNFVAMARELEGSQSILMLRSTRLKNGKRISNIIPQHGELTIPRHLRDVVITEYGIANLRGKTDEECIIALLKIADSEFQNELMDYAKKNKKLSPSYQLAPDFLENTPARISELIAGQKNLSVFEDYPFGSDFTPVEKNILKALSSLQSQSKLSLLTILFEGLLISPRDYQNEMERMQYRGLSASKTLLLGALERLKAK